MIHYDLACTAFEHVFEWMCKGDHVPRLLKVGRGKVQAPCSPSSLIHNIYILTQLDVFMRCCMVMCYFQASVQRQAPVYKYTPSSFRMLSIVILILFGIFSPITFAFTIPALLYANKVRWGKDVGVGMWGEGKVVE